MNMAIHVEVDRAAHGSQTVVGRLREYSRVRHEQPINAFQNSPFARIAEMKENAGIRSHGIRYDIITTEDDPEGTAVPPDGGLGELIERAGDMLTRQVRCQEVATAINQMPQAYRDAISAMYDVHQRERVRTFAEAALKYGKPKTTYQLILTSAYGWLEGKLCLPVDRYA